MMTLGFWTGVFLTVVVTLLTIEGSEAFAWFAVKLIHRSAHRMPSHELQERYDEEWLAELAAYDGLKIAKFLKALSIWWHSRQVERASEGAPSYRDYFRGFRAGIRFMSPNMIKKLLEDTPEEDFAHAAFFVAAGAYLFPGLMMDGDLERISETGVMVGIPYRGLMQIIHKYPIRCIIVMLYDMLLARGRTPLREIVACHRRIWRQLPGVWIERADANK